MLITYSPALMTQPEQRMIAEAIEWLRKNDARGALGFVPFQGILDQIRRDRVLCCVDAGFDEDPVGGFVLWCKNRNVLRILGICVPEDHRLQGRGRYMMECLLRHPATRKCDTIELRCAVDLDSNSFWKRLGCKIVDTVDGRNKTKRRINLYKLWYTSFTTKQNSNTPATISDALETSDEESGSTQPDTER